MGFCGNVCALACVADTNDKSIHEAIRIEWNVLLEIEDKRMKFPLKTKHENQIGACFTALASWGEPVFNPKNILFFSIC